MADRVGQRLGDYRLVQLLGQGGWASVYLGKHVDLDMLAAIKIFQTQLVKQDIERFRLEARIIAHLVHPHIVRVLKFGIEEHTPYLVMNYAPDGSLRQHHPGGSRLPIATIVSYVNQVALALQYAHEQKLFHRHIKPENLLVGKAHEILVSDFGIAIVDQHSRYRSPQDMVGAITYMAPEQLESHPHQASDQYSLGMVVYEWLAGEPPFQGSFAELALKQRVVPPLPLRERFPDIDPTVEAVVMKALAKDPAQRFTDIQAFAIALERACAFENTPTMYSIPVSPQVPDETIVAQVPAQQLTADTPQAGQKASCGISRRVVVSGLVGLATLAAVGGGIAWFSRRTASSVSSSTSSSITPTPAPPKLPANSPMFGFNPQHTRFNANEYVLSPSNVSRLVPYWSTPTGDLIDSTPAVVGKVVYVGSHDSKVYACDGAHGNIVWTAATGGAITSSPAVVNGVVYIGSADHTLYAMKADTGQTLWTAPAGDAFLSSPTVVNGAVYIGSVDHKLYALHAATGSILWTVTTGDSITASPSVINGVVYVGSHDHTVYAVDDFTGTILWTASTDDSILAAPAIANGVVYVGSADHSLYACDATTGKTIWTVSTGDRIVSGCAVANGVVYVGSEDHKLYACDATTGKVLWAVPTGDQLDSTPMIANGVVYVGSADHKLYACDATTGKILWTATTEDRVTSSPVVVNGVVYVGSSDHKLYAFHLPGA
jgi:outer membrane protein assembly factor BamB/tRNA A-37 threonylcarbamoyl transferase component Bud32